MKSYSLLRTTTLALTLLGASFAEQRTGSVKEAAGTIAYGLMKYYTGNNTGDTPGNLPDPYFWWEAGAMFGTLIDYWWITGDETYNNVTTQAMLHQVGKDEDYMPTNQTRTEGNDDQGFWAMAAMTAAENKFPDPPSSEPQWLALAQAVFNEYVTRWDTDHCDGGMRWQIFTFNSGFNYKNSISNGCFFNIAARLARYTGNSTYGDWATKVWEWEQDAGLISNSSQVFDGVTIGDNNCSSTDVVQWTYNAGIFLHGAAVMYNYTEKDTWKTRVDDMLNTTATKFYKDSIMYEQFCEESKVCDNDQQSFKGYLTRWLAATTQLAPYTYATIHPLLTATAKAAVAVCSGSPTSGFKGLAGTACGFTWLTAAFDGSVGVGPQMNALSAVMYTLVQQASAPVTKDSGGTSKGDANAGNDDSGSTTKQVEAITTGGRAAAWLITVIMSLGVMAGSAFILV
ncbi:hypothetical protein G7046_g6923 [Stylonectria norvegica]|nr:hypothetical protein G7046_g6923 [Stylonectria norvegica]